jgi:hypothetical protein
VSISHTYATNQLHISFPEEVIQFTPSPFSLSKCSVLICISADGCSFPSTVITNHVNVPQELSEHASENIRFISGTPKGWMSKNILEYIFEEILLPAINNKRVLLGNENLPVLLIVDGHNSRCSGRFFNSAIINNVDVLCIPQHCSHLIQPLDCGCNATFKNVISKFKLYENIENEKQKRSCFVSILCNALSSALSFNQILHSWKISGLFPPNPFIVLNKIPIYCPKYLKNDNKKYKRDEENKISGKLLVYACDSYSFNNLHKDYQVGLLPILKTSLSLTEKEISSVDSYQMPNDFLYKDIIDKEIYNLKKKAKYQKKFNRLS